MDEALTESCRLLESHKKSYIVAVNVDVIMKIEGDEYLKQISDEADITLVDGKPLVWISKLHGDPVKAKIYGSDFVPALLGISSEKGYSVFIIGGAEGVAEKARQNIEKCFPSIIISGTYSPPLGFEKDEKELCKINDFIDSVSPDIVIACLGCPKQEKWVYENYTKYNAILSVCAGATVDFLAGNVKRAPKWISNIGMEWFYRFLQEPRRLFKRYFIDDMKIIRLAIKYRNKRKA